MKKHFVLHVLTLSLLLTLSMSVLAEEPAMNVPPEGFKALFDGKTLDGWRGLGHIDPRKVKAMKGEEKTKFEAKNKKDMESHWKVEDGEIVNDGHGVYLTTDKDYGDFELLVDWKMVSPRTDSGIYLRGCPQIQIWDPENPREVKNGAPKGSGAMWNNNPGSKGRFPLMKADNPVGEWNSFRIKMIGDRVTVTFNDKLVVDNEVMHNFYEREKPMFSDGVIQLQTHGGEMRFRNVFLREIEKE